jgi:hypothetical protein
MQIKINYWKRPNYLTFSHMYIVWERISSKFLVRYYLDEVNSYSMKFEFSDENKMVNYLESKINDLNDLGYEKLTKEEVLSLDPSIHSKYENLKETALEEVFLSGNEDFMKISKLFRNPLAIPQFQNIEASGPPYIVTIYNGQEKTKNTFMDEYKFSSANEALQFANNKIDNLKENGYRQIFNSFYELPSYEEISKEEVLMKLNIKLPKDWNDIKENLLKTERIIYENHNDEKTKRRRNALSKKYQSLIIKKVKSEEINEVKKSAFLFLRYVYLRYLINMQIYHSSVIEAGGIAIDSLKKELHKLPARQKKEMDSKLGMITKKEGPLSLKEAEKGIETFIEYLTREIKEKEKFGTGGINRIRNKILAKNLRKDLK